MILALLAILVVGPFAPNPTLTPGVVRPEITIVEVCRTKWGRDVRRVTDAMRREAMRRYGVPWAKRHLYEIDHLIPRDLGGADVVDNLWPQPLDEARHIKDPLEVRIRKDVCAGTLSLEAAQRQLRRWGHR